MIIYFNLMNKKQLKDKLLQFNNINKILKHKKNYNYNIYSNFIKNMKNCINLYQKNKNLNYIKNICLLIYQNVI